MPSVSPQITASADDAHEAIAGGVVLDTVGIPIRSWTNDLIQTIGGLRFVLDVPQGATIVSAILSVNVFDFDAPACDIKAEQGDDPGDFSGVGVVARWPAGGPSVPWVASSVGEGWVALPDIATVLQPIVNRAGWATGQHVVILLGGRDDVLTAVGFTSWDGDPALAATLAVTYITSVPIDLVGSHTPNVDGVGSHTPAVDGVGSHVAPVDLVGSEVVPVDLVGSHTPVIELKGSWDE